MTFALVFCWRCRFTLSKSNFVENEREDSDCDCDEVEPLRVLPVAACLPPSQADSGLELSQERADSPCYHYLHHRQCRHHFHHHPKQILNIKNVIIEIWGLLNLYVSHKLALCWEGFKNLSKRKFSWLWGGGNPFSHKLFLLTFWRAAFRDGGGYPHFSLRKNLLKTGPKMGFKAKKTLFSVKKSEGEGGYHRKR